MIPMKDFLLSTPNQFFFPQKELQASVNFLQSTQPPFWLRYLVSLEMLRHVRQVKKDLRMIEASLPSRIDNTKQYMLVMMAMDFLDSAFDLLGASAFKDDVVLPGFLLRAIANTKADANGVYQQADALIKRFDPTPGTNYFFEKQDQRDIWKRRNKNYTYLNLQADDPNMAGLEAALDALTPDVDKN